MLPIDTHGARGHLKRIATRLGDVEHSDIHSPINRTLSDYWRAKRGDKPCPRLNEIDLMDLYTIAPLMMIRDRVGESREFRVRYWGTGWTQAFGFDATGKLLVETYIPEIADEFSDFYLMIMNSDYGYRTEGRITYSENREFISFEALFLPLLGNDGQRRHVIGTSDFEYKLSLKD